MGKFILKVMLTGGILFSFLMTSATFEARRIEKLDLHPVNLALVADGVHQGGFVHQNKLVRVEVKTQDHQMAEIKILEFVSGDLYKKLADSVVAQVLETQNTDIPSNPTDNLVVRAAKKALLFAIENALNDVPMPSSEEKSPRSTPSTLLLWGFFALCGSFSAQFTKSITFRSGMHGAAKLCGKIEQVSFIAGAVCAVLAVVLLITSKSS